MQDSENILVSGFDMMQKFVHVNKLLMFGTMRVGGGGGGLGGGKNLVSL
jgi:hypothetical protein